MTSLLTLWPELITRSERVKQGRRDSQTSSSFGCQQAAEAAQPCCHATSGGSSMCCSTGDHSSDLKQMIPIKMLITYICLLAIKWYSSIKDLFFPSGDSWFREWNQKQKKNQYCSRLVCCTDCVTVLQHKILVLNREKNCISLCFSEVFLLY